MENSMHIQKGQPNDKIGRNIYDSEGNKSVGKYESQASKQNIFLLKIFYQSSINFHCLQKASRR